MDLDLPLLETVFARRIDNQIIKKSFFFLRRLTSAHKALKNSEIDKFSLHCSTMKDKIQIVVLQHIQFFLFYSVANACRQDCYKHLLFL